MDKKFLLTFSLFTMLLSFLPAQEGGDFSLMVTPGVNVPLSAAKEMFTLGGGAELTCVYTMPFAPFLFAKGAIDYSIFPTILPDKNMSMITFGGGAGLTFDPAPWLNLKISGTGGYGLGIYSGQSGGSGYISGEGGVTFFVAPFIGIGAGASYRYYFSQPEPFYQGLRVNIGAIFRLGAEGRKANIEIPQIRLDPVFPIFYKHYDDHPLGNLTILNTENGAIKDVEVSFFVDQYMTGPKKSPLIEEIGKGEQVEVPLYALFTDTVLNITEGTKVGAEVKVKYTFGKTDLVRETMETVRLYDRNAMTWGDDRKAAAFVTAKDPEILKFAKNIAGTVREHGSKAVNLNFRIALGLFEGMGLYGVNYVVDPQTPYTKFSKDFLTVDYLQFPVQTLDYKAGDCDDLSICYTTMLESTGIETAFITIPGHIFMAFSLGIGQEEAEELLLNSSDLIFMDDKSWVPVEITMVQDGFLKAWKQGAKEWREKDAEGTAAIYPIHEAWEIYEPVGLPVADVSLSIPDSSAIMARYTKVVNRFIEREIAEKEKAIQEQIAEKGSKPNLVNNLGVLYAKYGLLGKAKRSFQTASASGYVSAMVNLGNIYFLENDYKKALDYYEEAQKKRPDNPKILLGIAKANYELENMGTVRRTYEKIMQKAPALAERFSYLVSESDDTARASAAMTAESVVWDEEEP